MAKPNFFNWVVVVTLFSTTAFSQQTPTPLPKGHYVVVAAFSPKHEDYATLLVKDLAKEGIQAQYGFESERRYWYVYVNKAETREDAVKQVMNVRTKDRFQDAWVHSIRDEAELLAEKSAVVEQTVKQTDAPKDTVKNKVTEVIQNPKADPVYVPQTLKNTQVFLSLFNATNNEVIDGDVEVVNTETSKLITRVKGNSYLTLPNPGTESGKLTLINNTFGYRKEQLEINYKNTEGDTVKPYVTLVGNFYMINFALNKIQKGDISTLYNVYFYNDAVVMLPESKYQLNSLLELLKSNDKMKIKLHGHTNGSGGGKIIYMGPSKNFFAVTKDAKNGSGSAKELSEARAETIKEWLIAQGIAADRIEVKGWGGGRMIYDKNSTYARKNIRVDVEVVTD
ncbi:MAG TPA: hypothetical protein DGG95_04610 [Cytophagales bacterium]|jgi:outer membrane protein OmpA-like peptidoglycan-associated protein|nr:hypothetical protein [Cytophagales bacterium]